MAGGISQTQDVASGVCMPDPAFNWQDQNDRQRSLELRFDGNRWRRPVMEGVFQSGPSFDCGGFDVEEIEGPCCRMSDHFIKALRF